MKTSELHKHIHPEVARALSSQYAQVELLTKLASSFGVSEQYSALAEVVKELSASVASFKQLLNSLETESEKLTEQSQGVK
ncbi:MAG: hypothetical protein EBZ49_00545 [Proteobacteria bacterium]|nr:hypothetical protein [Pseudomonadota bacterium]